MSYLTDDIMVREFGETEIAQLADRNRDGYPDDEVLEGAYAFADQMINDYLRARYTVPIDPAPGNLVGYAADIARYRLYEGQPTEIVQLRYDAALQWLRDVAKGLSELEVVELDQANLAYSLPEPRFTRLVW